MYYDMVFRSDFMVDTSTSCPDQNQLTQYNSVYPKMTNKDEIIFSSENHFLVMTFGY